MAGPANNLECGGCVLIHPCQGFGRVGGLRVGVFGGLGGWKTSKIKYSSSGCGSPSTNVQQPRFCWWPTWAFVCFKTIMKEYPKKDKDVSTVCKKGTHSASRCPAAPAAEGFLPHAPWCSRRSPRAPPNPRLEKLVSNRFNRATGATTNKGGGTPRRRGRQAKPQHKNIDRHRPSPTPATFSRSQ